MTCGGSGAFYLSVVELIYVTNLQIITANTQFVCYFWKKSVKKYVLIFWYKIPQVTAKTYFPADATKLHLRYQEKIKMKILLFLIPKK